MTRSRTSPRCSRGRSRPSGRRRRTSCTRENKWRLLRYRPRAEGTRVRDAGAARAVADQPALRARSHARQELGGVPRRRRATTSTASTGARPGDEDRYLTFDDVCDRVPRPRASASSAASVAARARRTSSATASAARSRRSTRAARPEHVASLLAARGAGPLRRRRACSRRGRAARSSTSARSSTAFGNVPWQLMQSAFQHAAPDAAPREGRRRSSTARANDEFLDGFLALETWGNDNVVVPRRVLPPLHRGALPRATRSCAARSRSRGTPARLEAIDVPDAGDHVRARQHRAVARARRCCSTASRRRDKELLHLPGGHVGAVVSRGAAKGLWPRLSTCWAERDGRMSASESASASASASPRLRAPAAASAASTRPGEGAQGLAQAHPPPLLALPTFPLAFFVAMQHRRTMRHSKLVSTGRFVPPHEVPNAALQQRFAEKSPEFVDKMEAATGHPEPLVRARGLGDLGSRRCAPRAGARRARARRPRTST